MPRKRLPKSQRIYIRREKARIRREVLDLKEQERLIQELYQKNFKNLKIKGNINKAITSDIQLAKL
ncbi:MAG: hypothetical protein Q8N73_00240 [bacterium]|nr:hypothetical protein [bacterium]